MGVISGFYCFSSFQNLTAQPCLIVVHTFISREKKNVTDRYHMLPRDSRYHYFPFFFFFLDFEDASATGGACPGTGVFLPEAGASTAGASNSPISKDYGFPLPATRKPLPLITGSGTFACSLASLFSPVTNLPTTAALEVLNLIRPPDTGS